MHELRHSRRLRALDQVDGLGHLAFEGASVHVGHLHGEDRAGPFGSPDQGAAVVEVAGDQLCAECFDGLRPGRVRVTDQRPDGNTGREQCAGGGAALLTRGSDYQGGGRI